MSVPFSLHHADARRLPVADASVHCVVTSPPYWGLRDYGHEGQIGLEATPEEYVAAMVDVFRDVRRVLRDDGVLWLNLGDSYVTAPQGPALGPSGLTGSIAPHAEARLANAIRKRQGPPPGMKPKDLAGIPWMVAFALRADGWWLRSDVIWAKPNPMPESVTDRPTKAHEYVFLLTKSASYFYDQDAIREPMTDVRTTKKGRSAFRGQATLAPRGADGMDDAARYYPEGGRNARDVWEIAPKPYSGAHFAVMPEGLAERCILAGTSAHGCCEVCGAPWVRDVTRTAMVVRPSGRRDGYGTRTSVTGTVIAPPPTGYAGVGALLSVRCRRRTLHRPGPLLRQRDDGGNGRAPRSARRRCRRERGVPRPGSRSRRDGNGAGGHGDGGRRGTWSAIGTWDLRGGDE